MCQGFLQRWNNHSRCIRHQLMVGQVCDPTSVCDACKDWDDTTWSLYLNKVKEVRSLQPRRALSYPATPQGPSWGMPGFGERLPYGPPGPWTPFGVPSPAERAAMLRAQVDQQLAMVEEAERLAQLDQLTIPVSPEALERGLLDADAFSAASGDVSFDE